MAAVATARNLTSNSSWRRAQMHRVRDGTRHALEAAHPVHSRNRRPSRRRHGAISDVPYVGMVREPEATLCKVLTFCNPEWEPVCVFDEWRRDEAQFKVLGAASSAPGEGTQSGAER